MATYSRYEVLYILAKVCKANNLTPNDPAYMGLIIKVCTSKLAVSIDKAKEYAADLTSAYHADRWETITQTTQETEPTQTTPIEPKENCSKTPTLNALKNLETQPYTPIKRIAPKTAAKTAEYSPKTVTQILLNMAKNNDFNGVGRISLAEARYELNDKSLQLKDLMQLFAVHAPTVSAETRPGNLILIYFEGKEAIRNQRDIQKQVQPQAPIMKAIVFKSSKHEYDNPEEYPADKDIGVGTVADESFSDEAEEETE